MIPRECASKNNMKVGQPSSGSPVSINSPKSDLSLMPRNRHDYMAGGIPGENRDSIFKTPGKRNHVVQNIGKAVRE